MTDDNLDDVSFAGACACLGPQNGEPLCPCEMRRVNAAKLAKQPNPNSVGKQTLIAQDKMGRNVYEREIWNSAIEHVAIDLKNSYPDHAAINAYCAAIRSNKK